MSKTDIELRPMRVSSKITRILASLMLFLPVSAALGQDYVPEVRGNIVTCDGVLVDSNQPHGDPPIGIVFDRSGEFSCAVDRRGAGHDPLRPCVSMYPCRISGTFIANGRTYEMQKITIVERLRR